MDHPTAPDKCWAQNRVGPTQVPLSVLGLDKECGVMIRLEGTLFWGRKEACVFPGLCLTPQQAQAGGQ